MFLIFIWFHSYCRDLNDCWSNYKSWTSMSGGSPLRCGKHPQDGLNLLWSAVFLLRNGLSSYMGEYLKPFEARLFYGTWSQWLWNWGSLEYLFALAYVFSRHIEACQFGFGAPATRLAAIWRAGCKGTLGVRTGSLGGGSPKQPREMTFFEAPKLGSVAWFDHIWSIGMECMHTWMYKDTHFAFTRWFTIHLQAYINLILYLFIYISYLISIQSSLNLI